MILNNRLITSLEAFRRNFNFSEVWNKLNILRRDLSPYNVQYIDDDIALYKAVCTPSLFMLKDGVLCEADGQQVFHFEKLNNNEMRILEQVNGDDNKKLVAAITRLAKTEINDDILHFFVAPKNEESNKLTLNCGQVLQISGKPSGNMKLRAVLISAEERPAKVGDYKLQPGESTLGVFNGQDLVAVCPHKMENNRNKLVVEGDDGLVVYDRSSGEIEARFNNARYFTIVDDNNFAIVDGRTVRTYQDSDLNRRIRNKVKMIDNPIMVDCDSKNIIITYENGSEEYIEI